MSELGRLEQLLASQATEGLSGDELMELRRLLGDEPQWREEDFELAAAALDLAMIESEEPMPESLRGKILQQAQRVPTEKASDSRVADLQERRTRRETSGATLPWLAAAAALVVALVGWWPRFSATTQPTPPAAPTIAELRTALGEREGTLARDWTATEDPAAGGASGDVVWSVAEQRGYMRFRGLAANEPSREQYQLWIFDKERDERFPVDGGVFDIPSGADEVLVPIDPKLDVTEPVLFAVTVEEPGGVVVSSRERIVLVAEV